MQHLHQHISQTCPQIISHALLHNQNMHNNHHIFNMPTKTEYGERFYQLKDIVTLTYSKSWQHTRKALVKGQSISFSSPSVKPLACPHGYGLKTSLSDVVQPTSLSFEDPRNLLELPPNKNVQEMMKPLNQNGLLEKEHNTCVFRYQEHLEERRWKRLSLQFSLKC